MIIPYELSAYGRCNVSRLGKGRLAGTVVGHIFVNDLDIVSFTQNPDPAAGVLLPASVFAAQ